jgi:hypothetical protein
VCIVVCNGFTVSIYHYSFGLITRLDAQNYGERMKLLLMQIAYLRLCMIAVFSIVLSEMFRRHSAIAVLRVEVRVAHADQNKCYIVVTHANKDCCGSSANEKKHINLNE